MSMLVDVSPKLWCIRAAIKLHNQMLKRILRCPAEYFDRTPVGRLLSRFSKDVMTLDIDLPMVIYSVVYCLFSVIFSFLFLYFLEMCLAKSSLTYNMYAKNSSCE